MFIQPKIFSWLQNLGIVKMGQRHANNTIELPSQIVPQFINGVHISKILKAIVNPEKKQLLSKLQSLKSNSSSPAIRIYNWNILIQVLKQFHYHLSSQQKNKIINQENQHLIKIIQHLYRENGTKQMTSQQPMQIKITQLTSKTLQQTSNIIQFLTVAICNNFKLTPQHAINLYLDNNKYLSFLLIKGIKGKFQPILHFISDIIKNINFIITRFFCYDEVKNTTIFLQAIKFCLLSKNQFVVENCLTLFNCLYHQYQINNIEVQIIKNWLLNGSIEIFFICYKNYPYLLSSIIRLLFDLISTKLFQFILPNKISSLCNSQSKQLTFYLQFLTLINSDILQQYLLSNQINIWGSYCVKVLNETTQVSEIINLIGILEIGWIQDANFFENHPDNMVHNFLNFLNKNNKCTSQMIFIICSRTLFYLMEYLGLRKNSYAPFLYKILITYLESATTLSRIQFLANNFIVSFQNIPNLPVSPLILPIAQQMSQNTHACLIPLIKALLSHNIIEQSETLELLELLTRVIFHDAYHGRNITEYYLQISNTINEDFKNQLMNRNAQFCLSKIYSICKSITKTQKQLVSQYKKQKISNKNIQQIQKAIIYHNIVIFLMKLIQMNPEINQFFEAPIFQTYLKIKQLKKFNLLLEIQPILKYYYKQQSQLRNLLQKYKKQMYTEEETQKQPVIYEPTTMRQYNSKNFIQNGDLPQLPKVQGLKPTVFALKDLDKIKKTKTNYINILNNKEEEQKIMQHKKQQLIQQLNEKRRIQFGVKNNTNLQYKYLYQWDSIKKNSPQTIKLYDYQLEQQSYVEDVQLKLKKYYKVWRFLFQNYSILVSQEKQLQRQEKIHISQLLKLFKNYKLSNFLKKQNSYLLFKLINQKLNKKSQINFLNYKGFQIYIIQISHYQFMNNYEHIPINQKINLVVQKIRNYHQQNGLNVDIFDHPDQVYFQQTEVVQEYNRILKQNPQYILPEGYEKVQQTYICYEYEINPALQLNIPTPYQSIMQIIDELISECQQLAFHIIQPLTFKKDKIRVKPVLFQKIRDKIRNYKKGYLLPKVSQSPTPSKKMFIIGKQFHPLIKFSLGIKMGIAQVPLVNKSIAEEVAYWMDDMLDSVENNTSTVQNKAKKKIQNVAITHRKELAQSIDFEKNQKEKLRKKNAYSLKKQLQKQKEIKRNDRYLQQQNKKHSEKQKKQKELQLEQQKQKRYKQMNNKRAQRQQKIIEQKRKQRQNNLKIKKQTVNRIEKYFEEKKKQIQIQQLKVKSIRQKIKQKQQQKNKYQKELKKKLYVEILKRQEIILENIQEIKQAYEEMLNSQEIENQFINYRKQLKYLFDLLLKFEKSKIDSNKYDTLGFNTLNYFALKFQIVPILINKGILYNIFKTVTKQKPLYCPRGVDFQLFEQTLFMITVKAKKILNLSLKKKKLNKKKVISQNQKKASIKKESQKSQQSDSQKNQESESEESEQSEDNSDKLAISKDYLFNVQGVSSQTLVQLIKYLKLPLDKFGIQKRFQEAAESKTVKPKTLFSKQLYATLQN